MLNEIKERWPDILRHLRVEYDVMDVSFNTWLKPLEVAAIEDDTIIIVVPEDSVGLNIIKKKYSKLLKVCIEEVLGKPYNLEFILPDQLNNFSLEQKNDKSLDQADIFREAGLEEKHTFSSFVVGKNNELAYTAALAVAENPGEFYNPLFIYGDTGLGKTHLIQAIGHFILKRDPQAKVIFVTAEKFTNEIIDAIRRRNEDPFANAHFQEKYRSADVLIIDDIQFISGKKGIQEEFHNTFVDLYSKKKQIIISSDKHPNEIKDLEERLCSRFQGGLTADVQSPEYETRVAILKKKIELQNSANIPDDVINYIATNVNSNIRELEGALNRIIAYSRLKTNEIIDLALAENVLQSLFTNMKREVTPDTIIKVVAEHFNVSVNDLTSKKKSQDIVYPRQLIMYFCRTQTDVALSLIGKKLGNRDHTTVLHGYEKIHKEIDENEKVRSDVEILKKKISPV